MSVLCRFFSLKYLFFPNNSWQKYPALPLLTPTLPGLSVLVSFCSLHRSLVLIFLTLILVVFQSFHSSSYWSSLLPCPSLSRNLHNRLQLPREIYSYLMQTLSAKDCNDGFSELFSNLHHVMPTHHHYSLCSAQHLYLD